MIHRWLSALGAPLSLLVASAAALADEPPGCPPGEWFCDDGEPTAPEPAPDDDAADAVDTEPSAAEEPEEEPVNPPPAASDEVRIDVPPASAEHGWSEATPSRWALALRGEGVLVDERGAGTRLGGVGASVRYALSTPLTFDLGLDSILGTDYNGLDHSELLLSLSSIVFLNQSDLVRTYVLLGVNVSSARVDVRGDVQSWGYFGGQVGLGLEFILDSHIGLNVDALAFMRGRTDSRAAREPEFTDPSGRVTNTSGGGLLRGGIVLRF